MKQKIRAIIKRPEDEIGVITEIDNKLNEFQKIVGGYIETVTLMDEEPQVVIICNEEGRLLDLPYNCTINGVDFVGPIIAVGIEGDDFGDLPSAITAVRWNEDFLELINGQAIEVKEA
jgi:hypothetical protein